MSKVSIDPDSIDKVTDIVKEAATDELFTKGKEILQGEKLMGILDKTVNPITANNKQKQKDKNLWSIYSENTKENYENYLDTTYSETGGTIKTLQYIKDAIRARHNHFNSTTKGLQCGPNINKIMEDFKNEEEENFNQLQKIFNGLKNSNKVANEYNNSMNVLKSGRLNELKGIKSKIDTYKQNLHIDGRKNHYSTKNYEFYKSIYFYVLVLYYFLLGLYFIFSDFYSTQKYKNKYYIIAIILYIIFPFLLNYILSYIYNAYQYYLEYYNLKEEVVSYPDIVNKYYKTGEEVFIAPEKK